MKFSLIFFTSISLSLCANATTLRVRHRDNPVNVTKYRFENFNKTSSLIYDSWFDETSNYLILNVEGTNYQYCGFTPSEWNNFKKAESLGGHYVKNIKGRFDCRQIRPPTYD
jgi:hypothetical protein